MENQIEKWVEMWEFPTYEISNLGNVRRAKNERPLKVRQDGHEYMLVSLFYQGRKYTKRLARLVWQSFNLCECRDTIDHLDGNRGNDNLGNLRCISMEENFKNRKFVPKTNKYNLTNQIKGLIHNNCIAGLWSSWAVMKKYGIPINYVRTVMKRKTWEKYGEEL